MTGLFGPENSAGPANHTNIYECIVNLKFSQGHLAFEFFFISKIDVTFFATRVTSKTKPKAFYGIDFIRNNEEICDMRYAN